MRNTQHRRLRPFVAGAIILQVVVAGILGCDARPVFPVDDPADATSPTPPGEASADGAPVDATADTDS